MDFGDILKLLFYIAIPFVISANRKARKTKQSSQNNRQPSQNNQQPVQEKTAGGGLMGRLESMMKELEQAAQTEKPAGGIKPEGQTAKIASSEGMDSGRETDQVPKEGREGYSLERPRRVGREASAGRSEDAETFHSGDYYASDDQGYGFFGKDDLVKGIIMSEILQPPVTKRSSKRL